MTKQTKQETSFAYELVKDVTAHAILFVADGKLTALKEAGAVKATRLASHVGSRLKTTAAKTPAPSRPEGNWDELETPAIVRKMGTASFERWQMLRKLEADSIAFCNAEEDAFILAHGENIEMASY